MRRPWLLAVPLLAIAGACGDDGPAAPRPPAPVELRPASAPENLVYNLEVLYGDTLRTRDERLQRYSELFSPDFTFHFQDRDYEVLGLPANWDLTSEVEAHRNLFTAQAERHIYSLTLDIEHAAAEPLDPPEPGHEEWRVVTASSVNLRLLVNPNDGFDLSSQRATFTMRPEDGRWIITDWVDLPRLRASRMEPAVEVPTWGQIKYTYRRVVEPPSLLPPTSAENLVENIEVIYNDRVRTRNERLSAYDNLFSRDFRFRFQSVDIENGLPESWGVSQELEAHLGLFGAQAERRIYSLFLSIAREPARPLDPPEEGREGWMEVFATNVYLKLLLSPDDGFEVNGAQGKFKMFQVPPPAGRWYIAEWIDLPRPEPVRPPGARVAVESSTWGSIKATFQ